MATATNAAQIDFAACTGGSNAITYVGVGRASSGTGELITSCSVTSLAVSAGITPYIAAGDLDFTGYVNFLKLLFQNVTWANIGDATGLQGSGTAGSLYLSLHTADPAGGNQTTSEATFTGYARKAVARDGTTWTVA